MLEIPAVLIAAYIVKALPLTILKWAVVVVNLYTPFMMFQSLKKKDAPPAYAPAKK